MARGRANAFSSDLLRRFFQAAFWASVLAVAYLAFMPADDVPVSTWDKANHVLAFAVMAGLAARGWPSRESAVARWGLLLGYGLLIEIVQFFLPIREFSLLDWLADGIGILSYLILAQLWRKLISPLMARRSFADGEQR